MRIFEKKSFFDTSIVKLHDDAGICIFDADGDGDQDMYMASGGTESPAGYHAYGDALLINDGTGKFQQNVSALKPLPIMIGVIAKLFEYTES